MSEHLPECPRIEYIVSRHNYTLTAGSNGCICDRLRACEQRVTDEIWGAIRDGSQHKSGFEGGLDAARDAVVALPHDLTCFRKTLIGCTCTRGQALAAIDALRGES